MATVAARRIARDVRTYDASDIATLHVDEANTRSILCLLRGAPDTPYAGGEYVVRVALPDGYPFDPPTMTFLTPNGRFEVGAPICTTFTSHHPEAWSSSHTLSSLVRSLASFMLDESAGRGSIRATAAERAAFAASSAATNAAKGYDAPFAQKNKR